MPAPDLVAAELTLTGRLTTAYNATFLGSTGDAAVAYKLAVTGAQSMFTTYLLRLDGHIDAVAGNYDAIFD